MATVKVYYAHGNKRSEIMARAAICGLRRIGEKAHLVRSQDYDRKVDADYAVFYGLAAGLKDVFEDYRRHPEAHAVYIDLGYWHRRIKNRYDGYHKIAVDSRHPTAYFQNRRHDPERFAQLRIPVEPWREAGSQILIAGMSSKAAIAESLVPMEWEKAAAAELKIWTDRLIRFRPKPNCCRTRPIPGTIWHKHRSIDVGFADCYGVVTHHSNVAVDAIVHGIPVYCEEGVGAAMSSKDLTQFVSDPYIPDNATRRRWLEDIAWTQFTQHEMAAGLPWTHLKDEGLIA